MLNIIGRLIIAPLPFVVFADFWVSLYLKVSIFLDAHRLLTQVADQFNSLAPALKDLHYFVCFYSNNQTTLGNGWDLAVDTEVAVTWTNCHF